MPQGGGLEKTATCQLWDAWVRSGVELCAGAMGQGILGRELVHILRVGWLSGPGDQEASWDLIASTVAGSTGPGLKLADLCEELFLRAKTLNHFPEIPCQSNHKHQSGRWGHVFLQFPSTKQA